MRTTLLVLVTFTLLCTGCIKYNVQTAKDILVNHDWVLKKALKDDENNSVSKCDSDNAYFFNQDGTAIKNNGVLKCDPLEPPSITFNFEITNDGKGVLFTNFGGVAGNNIDGHFIKLDNTTFEISFTKDSSAYDWTFVVKKD